MYHKLTYNMENIASGGIRYTYNGYDQVCNHLLEEYKKCTTLASQVHNQIHTNDCSNTLYLIEKICMPGKRKRNI